MACQPSSTFLLVASSTSKAGTIWPAGIASILIEPWVSFSRRSAKVLKCSCKVLLAGQVDCIFSDFVAGACAFAARLKTAAARTSSFILISREAHQAKPRLQKRQSLPVAAQCEHGCAQPRRAVLGRGDALAGRQADAAEQPDAAAHPAAREDAVPQARERERHDRHRRARKDPHDAGTELADLAVARELALRKKADQLAGGKLARDRFVRGFQQPRVLLRRRDRDRARRAEEETEQRHGKNAVIHHPADRPAAGRGDD